MTRTIEAVETSDGAGARLRRNLGLIRGLNLDPFLKAGRPIGEPIVQYGPFVTHTRGKIEQAIADCRDGRLTGQPRNL
ncbi:MAG: pirin-like C-terminal cupin domain-containing protein [Wenzhouxiangellaceae bacterium]|nr:pirin-like C-terminal cupin domain-containing protein [Wenzhouxiangellaceae bacterium]